MRKQVVERRREIGGFAQQGETEIVNDDEVEEEEETKED